MIVVLIAHVSWPGQLELPSVELLCSRIAPVPSRASTFIV